MNKQKASRAVLNLWRKNIYRYDPYISPSATFRKWYIGRKYQCVPDDCCQDLYISIKIKYEAFLSALLKVLNIVIYRSSYIDKSLSFSIIIS
ncbi:MAG: hypothetical protein J7L42_00215, partial [Elusimicrobia bacterium]|nr:hypothetical protein [Elusimicrobiota bacterium]